MRREFEYYLHQLFSNFLVSGTLHLLKIIKAHPKKICVYVGCIYWCLLYSILKDIFQIYIQIDWEWHCFTFCNSWCLTEIDKSSYLLLHLIPCNVMWPLENAIAQKERERNGEQGLSAITEKPTLQTPWKGDRDPEVCPNCAVRISELKTYVCPIYLQILAYIICTDILTHISILHIDTDFSG